jgi:hypothetical protein
MLEVTFLADYGFAEDGINRTDFKAGETRLVTTSCADSAVQAGAARIGKAKAEPENKTAPSPGKPLAAPENKAAPKQPKSKAAQQPR